MRYDDAWAQEVRDREERRQDIRAWAGTILLSAMWFLLGIGMGATFTQWG